ncbi:MAG: hypothetical protein ACM3SV_12250 [Betaproteobacteria bacterium]
MNDARSSHDPKKNANKPPAGNRQEKNKPGRDPQGENTQGSKGQSGPERTQSDTMNSSARQ